MSLKMKSGGALHFLLRGGGCLSLAWTKSLSTGPWIHISALLLTSWTEVRSPLWTSVSSCVKGASVKFPLSLWGLTSGLERYLQVLFTHKCNVTWLRVERDFEGHIVPLSTQCLNRPHSPAKYISCCWTDSHDGGLLPLEMAHFQCGELIEKKSLTSKICPLMTHIFYPM